MVANQSIRGSKLDADSPAYGVNFARRLTVSQLNRRKRPAGDQAELRWRRDRQFAEVWFTFRFLEGVLDSKTEYVRLSGEEAVF
ncbi:hypothetical protein NKH99_32230, partial [Mesorhizobium sp. M0854]|uniref:hypothetical protein n=1 Tax=Mesorhizobium sp. M0854 TaxID=2957013 RepID=UPI00333506F3